MEYFVLKFLTLDIINTNIFYECSITKLLANFRNFNKFHKNLIFKCFKKKIVDASAANQKYVNSWKSKKWKLNVGLSQTILYY